MNFQINKKFVIFILNSLNFLVYFSSSLNTNHDSNLTVYPNPHFINFGCLQNFKYLISKISINHQLIPQKNTIQKINTF